MQGLPDKINQDLGDKDTLSNSHIGVLVGSDHFWEIAIGKAHKITDSAAVVTTLEWKIQGPVTLKCHCTQYSTVNVLEIPLGSKSETELLHTFWKQDAPEQKDVTSKEDKRQILEPAAMELRKWTVNSKDLMQPFAIDFERNS